MYKNIIIIFAIIVFNIANLCAVECKQKTFIPALNMIPKTLDILSKSAVTQKTLKYLKKVEVSKKNYFKDIEVLEQKLSLLYKKRERALKAKKINSDNIKFWVSLEQNCKGKDLLAAKKVKNDVIDIEKIINKRLSTIEHYISITQLGIKIGKRKYSPNKKTTKHHQTGKPVGEIHR